MSGIGMKPHKRAHQDASEKALARDLSMSAEEGEQREEKAALMVKTWLFACATGEIDAFTRARTAP